MGVPRLVSADADSGKLPDVVLYDLGTRFTPLLEKTATAGLIPWHKALGVRGDTTAPVTALFTGDSWVEGSGGTIKLGQRMIDKVANGLGARFAPGLSVGRYLPACWGSPGATMAVAPAVLAGSATPELNNWGLGLRDVVMSNTGTVTWAVTGRYARLFYLKYPDQGTFNILVDGTQRQLVNTAGTADVGAYVDLDLTTDGSHTVQAAWASGGARVMGIYSYATTTQLSVIDGGHAGSFTHLFTGTTGAQHWEQAKRFSPALSIICTGLNTFYQLGISNFATDFRAVLANAKAALPNAAHMVVAQASPNNAASGAGGGKWSDFVQIQKDAAAEASVPFLDLGQRVPSYASDINGLWQTDGVHLNAFGQAMAGDLITAYLSPRP